MKHAHSFIYTIALLTALLLPLKLASQTVFSNLKDYSEYTVAFEIKEKETIDFLTKSLSQEEVMKLLHTPVASFKGDWKDIPSQGHFIFADINKNKVHLRYNPIAPFQVFLFNEYGKLTLQVIDAKGKIRGDANVSIKGRWKLTDQYLKYDRVSKTYSIDDTSDKEKRILNVKLDGFNCIFDLEKTIVYPQSYYNGGNKDELQPEFYSYMITDKNKYKPNENIRFKSYALSTRRKPLKERLDIWLKTNTQPDTFKKVNSIEPYNEGGYAGEVNLHDSLNLALDKNYTIQLRNKDGRIVSSTFFRYEDYDLFPKNNLEIELDKTHFHTKTNELKLRLTDNNGLAVLGARANISLLIESVKESHNPVFMFPLYYTIAEDLELNPDGSFTTVLIPSNIFESSILDYKVNVLVKTPEGDEISKTESVHHTTDKESITVSFTNDSISLGYSILGEKRGVKAEIRRLDSQEKHLVDLPLSEPFKQYESAYEIKILETGYTQIIKPNEFSSQIDLIGEIRSDMFEVELINPLNLKLTWFIYEGSSLLEKGSGTKMKFEKRNPERDYTHYVEIFYMMGGKDKVFRKTFIPQENILNLKLDIPERVYPGQKVDATISVKDNWNKGIGNVDLTAFATTSLLEYYVPDLPYYGSLPEGREKRSSYSIHRKKYSQEMSLNYKFWEKLSHLDEQTYYQLAYPQGEIYTATIKTNDGSTQFAPYVFSHGEQAEIHEIRVDNKLIYSSDKYNLKAYSFYIEPLKEYDVSVRLSNRILILKKLKFKKGVKTILSLNLESLPTGIQIEHRDWISRKNYNKNSIFILEKELNEKIETFYPLDGNNIITASELSINDGQHHLHILLPQEEKNRIQDVFFLNRDTKEVTKLYQRAYPSYYRRDPNIFLSDNLNGLYDIFVYFDDGYIKQDSVLFSPQYQTFVDMNKPPKLECDSVWKFWINNRHSYSLWNKTPKQILVNSKTLMIRTAGTQLTGTVRDNQGEELIGVSIYVEGTDYGTVTDIDGNFILYLDKGTHNVVFNYIGFEPQTISASGGMNLDVIMEESTQLLEEVVVMGYGVVHRKSVTGAMSSISGDNTNINTTLPREEIENSEEETIDYEAEERLYKELMQLNGLRSNFSDVGFWQPSLVTNKKGEAKFEVTFPDDITRWDAVVYAMNSKLKTGTLRQSIKSYKPLMAELRTPNFLVEGDSCHFSGMIRNYTKDNHIAGILVVKQDGKNLSEEQISFKDYRIDQPLMIATATDSLKASYLFTRDDGYNDGEERSIPINKKGILVSKGDTRIIKKDSSHTIKAENNEEIEVRLMANTLDVFMQSVDYLRGYEHACNEQLSSRLIGILNYKIYQAFKREEFKDETTVKLIMNRLKQHQNNQGLWSWWNKEEDTAHWMSAQVIRAFAMANNEGYKVDINLNRIIKYYFESKNSPANFSEKVDILQAISEWDKNDKLIEIAQKLEKSEENISTMEQLSLWEVIAKNGGTVPVNAFKAILNSDETSELMYIAGGSKHWRNSDLMTTLSAYRVARHIPELENEKEAIVNYILLLQKGQWNTYTSANIVSTLLKDLTMLKHKEAILTLDYSNGKKESVSDGSYKTKLAANESVTIKNNSAFPVIVSNRSQLKERRTKAQNNLLFSISTSLKDGQILKIDSITNVNVSVDIHNETVEYLVIEVPIPAGCIYEPKSRANRYRNYGEVHREYFKDKLVIYCDRMTKGNYRFNLTLLPKYEGTYSVNPAMIEQMYEPGASANSNLKTVYIKK